MRKPNLSAPPPNYQVMTIAEARQEFPEDGIFTTKDFCKSFDIADSHWCYVVWTKPLSFQPSQAYISATDYGGPYEHKIDACRDAWRSYLRFHVMEKLNNHELNRIIANFQTNGRL